MKCSAISLFALLLPLCSVAQQANNPVLRKVQAPVKCYTTENEQRRHLENPSLPSEAQFEQWIHEKISTMPQSKGQPQTLILPLIFHVIHLGEPVGTGRNVPAEAVYAQIDQLNNDYGRILGTSGFNENPDGANLHLSFCPALVDEEGNLLEEPGIERINSNLYSWGQNSYNPTAFDNNVKPVTIWNPDNYINVWTAPMSIFGILKVYGYAQFPTQSGLPGLTGQSGAATDGVVVDPFTLGSTEEPNLQSTDNLNLGRTLTHELGHFFGLRHIWGDGGCGVDDYCADTPEASAANDGCPTGKVTCGSVDMIENYMDYTDDFCKNTFTKDQRDRARAVLTNSPRRNSLLTSTVCEEPNLCIVPSTSPAEPTSSLSAAGVDLSWEPQPSTLGCQVRLGLGSGGGTAGFVKQGDQVTHISVPASELLPNTTYHWRVRCGCSAAAVGPWSNWQQFTTPQLLPALELKPVNGTAAELNFDLYPNPATDRVVLSPGAGLEPMVIEVFDVFGKRLVLEELDASSRNADHVIVLPSDFVGVCFVKVIDANGRLAIRRLMVQ